MCQSKNLPIRVSLAIVILLFCYTGVVKAGVVPGDLCADAIGVGVPSSTMGSTSSATNDSAAACGDATAQGSPGVWYTVTGTGNTITASTCNMATNLDTELSVWCGDCADLMCVAGNDDGAGCTDYRSEVSWCSQAGATYRILVYGYDVFYGNFDLDVSDDGNPCTPTVVCEEGGNCEEAQQAVQDEVGNEDGSYRNHGKYVRAAAHEANQFDITEECHNCIVSQFARRIPIEEQEVCTDTAAPTGCCLLQSVSCEEQVTEQDCPSDHVWIENGLCDSGGCVCDPGLTDCAGTCVDLSNDNDNCGACGNACGIDQHCDGGGCVCDPGLTQCAGTCVDLDKDHSNCGACGVVCDLGGVCVFGACVILN